MDYANGKIYRIVCEETHRQYIGSTCTTLVKRLSNHKSKWNKCKSNNFVNPKIFLIEDYPCERKDQLLMRERYHIENTECVNLHNPISSPEEKLQKKKEYYAIHSKEIVEKNREYNKQWRIDNKEHCKMRDAKYRSEHLEDKKQYYLDNSGAIKERSKKNYEKNKVNILSYQREQLLCECGSVLSRANMKKHKTTKKHHKLLEFYNNN